MKSLYWVDYVRRAVSLDALEPPNQALAGDNFTVLEYVYLAHQSAHGTTKPPHQAATDAWNTIARERPTLGRVFAVQKHLYSAPQLSEIPRMSYALPDYPLYERGFNVLIGARGTGKSFVAVDIASQYAKQHPVLYIAAEGASVYNGRVKAWHHVHEETVPNGMVFFGRSVRTDDESEFNQFIELVVKPIKPRLIVVDTVARCMTNMDENSSSDMKRFVERWDTLREYDATLLFVHHVNRTGKQRGSGVLDDSADSVMILRRVDGIIHLRNDEESGGKNKDSAEAPPLYFKIKPVEIPGTEFVGDDAAAVLEKQDKKTVNLAEVDSLLEGQLAILRLLEGLDEGMTNSELVEHLTGQVSKSSVYRYTSVLTKSGYVLRKAGMYTLTEKGQTALDSNPEGVG